MTLWRQRPHRRNLCTNRSGRHRSHQAGNIEHWDTSLDNAACRVTKQRRDRVTTRRVLPRRPHEAQAHASQSRNRLHSVSASTVIQCVKTIPEQLMWGGGGIHASIPPPPITSSLVDS
jgi:hypothetical protein